MELSAAQIILGGITAALTALGGAKLLEMFYRRRLDRRDRQEAIHESNQSKAIDADVNAFNQISKRLEAVESWVKDLNEKLSKEMQKSSKLEAENDALRKDNARQETEIQRQRASLHEVRNLLQQRDAQILKLQIEIQSLTARFDATEIKE